MTLLVTGGAGFIGSNFVLDWFSAPQSTGEPVVTLDALTYAGNLENLAALRGDARHTLVQGDICDRALVDQLLGRAPPTRHRALRRREPCGPHGPGAFIRTNVEGTFTLLEAARAYWRSLEAADKAAFRFHHVSTDEVYGSLGPNDPAFTETHPYEPNSPYSASKAASDHLVRAWRHTYGLLVLTTNCSNNYGLGRPQNPSPWPNARATMATHATCWFAARGDSTPFASWAKPTSPPWWWT
jgi:dTDP-glucose 4,6-dehydratase